MLAFLSADAHCLRYVGLIFGTAGAFALISPLLDLLTYNLFNTTSTGIAITLEVGIGHALGQIAGGFIYIWTEERGGFRTGHWITWFYW
jgi:hypothetical protein